MSKSPPPSPSPTFAEALRNGAAPLVLALVQTSLVAWFGLQITGKLDMAIKEREVALESAKSMAVLVENMQKEAISEDQYHQNALRLAMYGKEAIQPLIFMAAAPGPYSEDIPLDGLKLVYVLHRDSVCDGLLSANGASKAIDAARFKGIAKTVKELEC